MNKKRKVNAKYILGGSLIAFGLLTSGCGGSSSSSNKPDSSKNAVSMQGTAAIGSPIANGTLTAKCSDGSGFTNTVTTQANGAWSGTVTSGALPCALQITGGTPNVTLHSFATQAGNVNITPLTDLALALATSSVPADWFNNSKPTASLLAAISNLETALKDANFTLPSGSFDPFTAPFTATTTDGWDQLLEQIKGAIEADSSIADYAALVNLIKDGNVASFPLPVTGGSNGTPATVPAAMVGTHTFKYTESQSGSGISNGAVKEFEVMADNRLRLPSGDFLSNPVFSDNSVEIIWQDSVSKLSYALSNATTGTIHELNISYSMFGKPDYQLYGSFQPFNASNGSAPAALLALAGNYSADVYYSNNGNSHSWEEGDELSLSINATTGIIDVASTYTIDPADESFSWNDDTAKNPTFGPRYEILYTIPTTSTDIKLILYQRPGEALNGWRIQEFAASGPPVVNTATDITPFIQEHQDYFTSLENALPATLIMTAQDSTYNSGLDGALCSEYSFDINFSGTNDKPQISYQLAGNTWPNNFTYTPSHAAYSASGTAVSIYWSGFVLEIDGETLTATAYKLGLPVGDVVTNNSDDIIAAGCN